MPSSSSTRARLSARPATRWWTSRTSPKAAATVIPLQIGPVKYACLQLNSLELIAAVGQAKMARTVGGRCNWAQRFDRTFSDWYDPMGICALGAQAARRLKGLGLCVADGGGKGPVRGEHR